MKYRTAALLVQSLHGVARSTDAAALSEDAAPGQSRQEMKAQRKEQLMAAIARREEAQRALHAEELAFQREVLEELHDRDNKNVHIERMREILCNEALDMDVVRPDFCGPPPYVDKPYTHRFFPPSHARRSGVAAQDVGPTDKTGWRPTDLGGALEPGDEQNFAANMWATARNNWKVLRLTESKDPSEDLKVDHKISTWFVCLVVFFLATLPVIAFAVVQSSSSHPEAWGSSKSPVDTPVAAQYLSPRQQSVASRQHLPINSRSPFFSPRVSDFR